MLGAPDEPFLPAENRGPEAEPTSGSGRRSTTMSQLQLIPTWIPKIRPNEMLVVTAVT